MREAELPIVGDTECIRKINAVTEKIFILPASSFCAGGEAGNDACQVCKNNCFRFGILKVALKLIRHSLSTKYLGAGWPVWGFP